MPPTPNQGNVPTLEVLSERLATLAEAMDDIKRQLTHMATKEQVAMLVSRPEFDRQTWEIQQLKKDFEKDLGALRKEIDDKSVGRLWTRLTTFAAGLSGVIALILTLWGIQKQ